MQSPICGDCLQGVDLLELGLEELDQGSIRSSTRFGLSTRLTMEQCWTVTP